MAQAEAAGPSEPAPSGWGQRRRMSVEEVADDEADELPLLAERRQEPLAAAMELLLTSKGVKALGKAIKKGASLNSPFTDSHGFDRLALHCAIDRTMRTDVQEEWENGQGMIAELLARGAQPNKLDGNSRTALTVLKSLLLGPNDRHNGKEQIVRDIAAVLIKAGAT
eukprot:m.107110 g.107110  ORF g.107110 m.107110 type:complete len:167 (+) comp21136_c0_seq2:246-746(+)